MLEELYTQRLKEGNICRLKLSSLRLHRLRLSKLKLHRLSGFPGFENFQITTMHFQTTTMGSRLENFKFLNYNNGLRLGMGARWNYILLSLSRKKLEVEEFSNDTLAIPSVYYSFIDGISNRGYPWCRGVQGSYSQNTPCEKIWEMPPIRRSRTPPDTAELSSAENF